MFVAEIIVKKAPKTAKIARLLEFKLCKIGANSKIIHFINFLQNLGITRSSQFIRTPKSLARQNSAVSNLITRFFRISYRISSSNFPAKDNSLFPTYKACRSNNSLA